MTSTPTRISLKALIGGHYERFWHSRARFVAVKGSKASKKSKTAALWLIWHLKRYPLANALVVRRYFSTLKDSCYADLIWAIERLGLSDEFTLRVSPLEIEHRYTGQKILFRGFDDAKKLASVTVPKGVICWVWIEEAYEVTNEEDFDRLNFSIRGQLPEGYFYRFMLTFNPWSDRCFLKRRFFDKPDPDVLALTTTYLMNEFIDDDYKRQIEKAKDTNPRMYRIAGLGEWGISEGLIYERTEVKDFDLMELVRRGCRAFYGVDFGFTDPTAFIGGCVDEAAKVIYIALEWYATGVTNEQIAKAIKTLGVKREAIYCDSAEPKSIEELRRYGLNAMPASKGADSVRFGIQKIQGYALVIHPSCKEFWHEVTNYTYAKDRAGQLTDRPDHEFSHGPDALRYGVDGIISGDGFTWRKVF